MDADVPPNQFERQRMPYSAASPSSGRRESLTRPAASSRAQAEAAQEDVPRPQPKAKRQRYGPRTCRICYDTEYPKFPSNASTAFGVSINSSRPTYESDDAELGRLLSPCKCKGSSKFVHEGCLNAWRLTDSSTTRNYWQCPTCKFTYRLARLHWATRLSSTPMQIAVTVTAIMTCLFLLGFIADPILDMWFDPVSSIAETVSSVVSDVDAKHTPLYGESTTWTEHFTKGFFSLGLIGAVKSLLAVGPWHWINFRAGGLFGAGRRGGAGRNRVENFNYFFVAIGAFTFMMAVWRFVKALSARVLAQVSDSVLDVGVDDDYDDGGDDDDGNGGGQTAGDNKPPDPADAENMKDR